jgi:hypothetical protein
MQLRERNAARGIRVLSLQESHALELERKQREAEERALALEQARARLAAASGAYYGASNTPEQNPGRVGSLWTAAREPASSLEDESSDEADAALSDTTEGEGSDNEENS